MKKIILLTILFTVSYCIVNAQSTSDSLEQKSNFNANGNGKLWEKQQGTLNIYKSPLLGNVGIGTDSPQHPLEVIGEFVADSARIFGTLAIGTNSMYLNSNPIGGTGTSYDQIASSYGIIALTKTLSPWNIKLGVGTTTPQTKQHLWDRLMVDVFTTYTHGTTNSGNTNGFQVGLSAADNAELKQKLAKDMLFYTSSIEYMRLTQLGRLGIGTSAPLTKQNLHDATATTVYSSFTNLNSDLGLYVGINNLGNAEIRQNEDLPITMHTNFTERFRITRKGTDTRVAISNGAVPLPVSMLHVGYDLETGAGGGARSWMNVGTFYYEGTDNMYVGLQKVDLANDRVDAIINWGDNKYVANGVSGGPDDLRFIFTAPFTGGSDPANNDVGAEIARMTYRGATGRMGICESQPVAKLHITANNAPGGTVADGDPLLQLRLTRPGSVAQGIANCDFKTWAAGNTVITPFSFFSFDETIVARNMGFGSGFTANFQPQRKVDILDNSDLAQIRLTYTQNIFTDIHTEAGGNLLINPTNSQTGFNLSTTDLPTQAIDVAGNVRIRDITDGTNSGIVTYEDNVPNSKGTLHKIAFQPANSNLVLHGDGSWSPASGSATVTAENGCSVNGSGKVEFGTSFLTHNTELPLNKYYINFSGQGDDNSVNSIGIGLTGNPQAKLHVLQNSTLTPNTTTGLLVENGNPMSSYAVDYGIVSRVYGTTTWKGKNVAGYFKADLGYENFGIRAEVPDVNTDFAGFFIGNVKINGTLTTVPYGESDIMLKQNLQPISNSLNLISQLNPQTFNFRTSEFPQMRLPQGEQFGLIAQEVEAILPDLVIDAYQPADIDTAGNELHAGFTYKALNYTAIVPILIQSVKDQQTIITAQQTKIDSLENQINSLSIDSSILARLESLENCVNNLPVGLCGNDNTKSGSTDINSVINITPDNSFDKKETVLEQNVPNPFTIKTTFNYSLGTKGNVELEIITYSGQFVTALVNTHQEEGSYSIDWNTSDIAPGIYFYTLRVDGVEWVKKAIRIK